MSYELYALRDNGEKIGWKGDSGSMSLAMKGNEVLEFSEPRVGYAMRVGTYGSRSFSLQDYWTTTYVTEIVSREETPTGVVVLFKTKNSTYRWEKY